MCLVNIGTVTRGTVKQVCIKYCYLGRALSQKTSQCAQSINAKMVFLTNESANKAEIDILSARDTTRPGL